MLSILTVCRTDGHHGEHPTCACCFEAAAWRLCEAFVLPCSGAGGSRCRNRSSTSYGSVKSASTTLSTDSGNRRPLSVRWPVPEVQAEESAPVKDHDPSVSGLGLLGVACVGLVTAFGLLPAQELLRKCRFEPFCTLLASRTASETAASGALHGFAAYNAANGTHKGKDRLYSIAHLAVRRC